MTTRTRTAAGAALVLVAAAAYAQDPKRPLPTTARSRISDEAIKGDHDAFAAVQERIRLLNESGVPIADYQLAKAQAYLDMAFSDYHENDRSGVVEAAMIEAVTLIQALERGTGAPSMDTRPLRGEQRLRPDLWAQAEALKQLAGFTCAAPHVARFEVALLHAGHEATQGGWRRARPHVETAEDFAARAQAEAASCSPTRR